MPSFKETRDFVVLCYDQRIIDDEEFLVLYESYTSSNLDLPYDSYPLFDLEEMDYDECLAEFRVKKRDIPVIAEALQIPDTVTCTKRSKADGTGALCMLLKRLSYPTRYSDMVPRFARPVPVLSMLTNQVLDYIYETHSHRMTDWNAAVLNPPALETYTQATSQRGSPLQNSFGFIDGTVRPIARPDQNQRIVYNGHKIVHALKFQSLAFPNGIIGHLYDPVGKKHDAGMLRDSQLLQSLHMFAFDPHGQQMCIYGDPEYPLRIHLQAPFRNGALIPKMMEFNAAMSEVRISVEWLFGDIINYFKFEDFKKKVKIGLSSVGKMYVVSALLRNALTCLYGNQTSAYCGLDPPSLQDYFA